MLVVKLFTVACLIVIIAAWVAESHKNGNRVLVWMRAGVDRFADWLYEATYCKMWRALMRHAGDPAYSYQGRHFK